MGRADRQTPRWLRRMGVQSEFVPGIISLHYTPQEKRAHHFRTILFLTPQFPTNLKKQTLFGSPKFLRIFGYRGVKSCWPLNNLMRAIRDEVYYICRFLARGSEGLKMKLAALPRARTAPFAFPVIRVWRWRRGRDARTQNPLGQLDKQQLLFFLVVLPACVRVFDPLSVLASPEEARIVAGWDFGASERAH